MFWSHTCHFSAGGVWRAACRPLPVVSRLFIKCFASSPHVICDSLTDSPAGQSVRSRRILQDAHDGGRPCPSLLTQTKPCPISPCYTWVLSDWSSCTVEVFIILLYVFFCLLVEKNVKASSVQCKSLICLQGVFTLTNVTLAIEQK